MTETQKISKKDMEDIISLTPMQEGMLFHYLKDSQSDLYFEQICLKVKGEIDDMFFEKAWNFVIETNEILRTVYRWESLKRPLQIVLKKHRLSWLKYDLSDKENKEEIVKEIKIEDKGKRFDLYDVPFRITLCKLGKEDYEIIISYHHILFDGWSTGIILKEFFNTYDRLTKSMELKRPIKNRFKEFIKLTQQKDKNKQKNYWSKYLEGYKKQNFHSLKFNDEEFEDKIESCKYRFPENMSDDLRNFAASQKITLAAVLYSAWGLLLQKYTDSEDVVFGTTVSGRNAKLRGIEDIVGLFINTMPLRVRTKSNEKVLDLLQTINNEIRLRVEFENTSLVDIKSYSQIRRDENLFDSIVVIENYPIDNILNSTETSLSIDSFSILEKTNYDLTMGICVFDRIEAALSYNTNLFDDEAINKLLSHFVNITKAIVENPHSKLKEIEILSQEEKKEILCNFNNTKVEYPREKTIHELFQERVEYIPDNVALVFKDIEMAYEEVNKRSNQLARTLRKKGVGPETIVGIITERSIEMIVGILGILKAGGAYLPLDPKTPSNRIKYMLEDSDAHIILAQSKFIDGLEFQIEKIDLEDEGLYIQEDSNLDNVNRPTDLAYVIYTSGSTGKPKGVMVEHRSVINVLSSLENKYPLSGDGAYLLKTNYIFDVSVAEIFGWFFGGGRLVILENGLEKEPLDILRTLEENKVTHCNFTPSMLQTFLNVLRENDSNSLGDLKYIFSAGEALHVNTVRKFYEFKGSTRLENLYGPTEATIYSTMYSLEKLGEKQTVPIGKPIDNCKMYILDKNNRIQPIGVQGELCIGGDGVARGYLKRPELTAERFAENPFTADENIYRTGDLARWLPDGNIEFLGRIDNQVKIRGYRIELGEIENSLLRHGDIKETVVVAREDEEKNKQLYGYIVSEKELKISEIRRFLSKELPEYMIPSSFIQIEEMPLTPSGKIDRSALPEPDKEINLRSIYEKPRDEVEKILAGIWREVLSVKGSIGINDNFFELGGDSIKAIQISSRLQRHNLKIEIQRMFDYPTIKGLRDYVRKIEKEVEQTAVEGEVKLTPIQKWFYEEEIEERHHWNQGVMLYRRNGFRKDIVEKVFNELIKHHDVLRMTYKKEGEEVTQVNRSHEDNLLKLQSFEVMEEEYKEIIEKKASHIQGSIDLERGPLVKLALFETKKGDYLLIAIHHLIIDGVSWRIVLEDFSLGYKQLEDGAAIELPLKTTSFKEWSDELYKYADSKVILKEIEYWKELEKEEIERIPRDVQIKEDRMKDGETREGVLTKEETKKLLNEVHSAYNTEINDILLTALKLTLKKWTGAERSLVELEGHGREEIIEGVDITRTVGWFTTAYPLVMDMKECKEIGQALKATKETLRRVPNKGIGYGILKYISKKESIEGIEFKLRPEISFNYLGQFDSDINTELFKKADISTGDLVSPNSKRFYRLQILGMIEEGTLKLYINYNKHEYREATILQLLRDYMDNLREIIKHCIDKDETEMTASDFSSSAVNEQEMDIVFNKLNDIFNDKIS
ncbi:amino acid adenylation domain-containing protein [Wukongibacter sp. M2B1]|uniref:amino acid adenylation domain-containing protein n=1 Tax=Wukongibacter sp. M2B1 TaxID=3088895 RepID=UPI003D79A8C5